MSATVVLLSGGVDSMVIAEMLRVRSKLGGCVFVDYGHPAQVPEAWKAFQYCMTHCVPLKVIHAFGLNLGEMATEQGARVVPARNAILLGLAANAAAALGASSLAIGVIGDDQTAYDDCRPSFLAAMSKALGMTILSPLIDAPKASVMRMAAEFGITNETWSCYLGGPSPCGKCPSCVARHDAEHPR